MKLDHKAVGVNGLKVLSDEDGIVETIVSVTGIKDNVNDIILPGAYEKSLQVRTPKGVWHHNWHESISRTESIKELLPGDPDLPERLPNGTPWPAEAGALLVKTRFNLNTTRGKDAYEDVKFFGDQQEWSIGYNVPVGGATIDSKSGIRKIHTLDLYEYSPVLFGAMPAARTSSVKDAQTAYAEIKSLHGDEAQSFLMEVKSIIGESAFVADQMEEKCDKAGCKDKNCKKASHMEPKDEDQGLEDEDEWVEEDEVEEKGLSVSDDLIRNAISALQACLEGGKPSEETQEEKSLGMYEAKELSDIIADQGYDDKFVTLVKAFDTAVAEDNIEAMEENATPILDFVEAMQDMDSGEEAKSIAEYIADQFKSLEEDEDLGDEEEEGEESGEEDVADDPEAEEEDPEKEEKSSHINIEMKSIDLALLQAALSDD